MKSKIEKQKPNKQRKPRLRKARVSGSGIAEGRDLKDKSFNLAQIPIEVQTIF